jgi:hypothetical protein
VVGDPSEVYDSGDNLLCLDNLCEHEFVRVHERVVDGIEKGIIKLPEPDSVFAINIGLKSSVDPGLCCTVIYHKADPFHVHDAQGLPLVQACNYVLPCAVCGHSPAAVAAARHADAGNAAARSGGAGPSCTSSGGGRTGA